MNNGTAPASITIRVCCDVPDAILVRAQAASNYFKSINIKKKNECAANRFVIGKTHTCKVVLLLFPKNSTNLGTIPAWMTSSIGGFGSRDNSFRNFCIAFNWSSSDSLYKSATISCVIVVKFACSTLTLCKTNEKKNKQKQQHFYNMNITKRKMGNEMRQRISIT